MSIRRWKAWIPFVGSLAAAAAVTFALADLAGADHEMKHVTGPFSGVKVNGGTVTHASVDGRMVLTLSEDVQKPDSPDPHWQVIDSKGTVYLLQRLDLKDGKMNRTITLPEYVKDVAKVQMWCAWAEVVLGEAAFAKPVM